MSSSDDIYLKICSIRTVQSNKEGFFNEFYYEVKNSCGEKWLKNYFSKLKSNEARILSIFNDRECCDTVLAVLENVAPVFKFKDATFGHQRKLQADKACVLGKYKEGLAFANLSIMRTPKDDGNSLGQCYMTRSSVLIGLGDGERALTDLKMACLFGIDSKKNPDYFLKSSMAYALLGEKMRSEIALKVAENLLNGPTDRSRFTRSEIEKVVPKPKPSPMEIPEVLGGLNENLYNASKSIKLVESPDKGRFVVTNDFIKTGDTLLVEDPIAACLVPDFFGSHCHNCFAKLFAPIPCEFCSGLAFCSTQCMGEACSTYHRFECHYMDLLIGSGMSILCFIALRIFTQATSVENGLTVANKLIENMCSHSLERTPDDLLQRSVMAAFLLRILQKVEYFGRRTTEAVCPTALEIQVGAALLGLLQVLQFNVHEIYGTSITGDHIYDDSKAVYVGAGLFGTGSYFNHECWPSVTRHFVGKKIVLTSTRPMGPNEIVSENYGPVFTTKNLKERQRDLRARYLFDCNCIPCRENWPLFQKLDKSVRFKCTSANCGAILRYPKDLSKDVRCSGCRKNISLKESVVKVIKVEEMYREAAEAMKEQDTDKALGLFKEAIDMFFEVAVLPHKDTLIAQQSLRTCLADKGTKFDCRPLV